MSSETIVICDQDPILQCYENLFLFSVDLKSLPLEQKWLPYPLKKYIRFMAE